MIMDIYIKVGLNIIISMENMTDQKISELANYAASLYQNHVEAEEIKAAMMRQGADEELANKIVTAIISSDKKEKRGRGKYYLILGSILLGAGLINTYSSYTDAEPGEEYQIYLKLILGGLVILVLGLVDYVLSRKK